MSKDGITGLVALVTSLVFFALTLDLKQNPMVPIGPGFYPRIVLGVTAVLAAALLIFDLLAKKKPAAAQGHYGLVVAVFAIFGIYVGLLPYLGFRIATLLFVAGLQTTIEPPKGARGWIVVAVTAILTTVIAYYLFERELMVLLPRGRWTDF
jgi:hypothetical protein